MHDEVDRQLSGFGIPSAHRVGAHRSGFDAVGEVPVAVLRREGEIRLALSFSGEEDAEVLVSDAGRDESIEPIAAEHDADHAGAQTPDAFDDDSVDQIDGHPRSAFSTTVRNASMPLGEP